MQARISLCLATRVVLANLLKLLKITAPESMYPGVAEREKGEQRWKILFRDFVSRS